MNGAGGELRLFNATAGTLGRWFLRTDAAGVLTFTSSGRFARYWLSAGATRGTVLAHYHPRTRRSDRRPASAARPILLTFTGDIQSLTATEVVLINVTTRATT